MSTMQRRGLFDPPREGQADVPRRLRGRPQLRLLRDNIQLWEGG